jgi:hypothetical protein
MNEWLTLTEALSRTMRAHAPGWTDRVDADPGITMLEMLAFLAEGLRTHRGLVASGSPTTARIIEALSGYDEPDPIAIRVNGTLWRRVDAFAEAGADDLVYVVDLATGTVTFGDGVHGRRPETGDTVTARDGAAGTESIVLTAMWPLQNRGYRAALRDDGSMQLERWTTAHEHWCGPKRPRFFAGRLLTADDFTEEQSYHREKHRRHVLAMHGSGVVDGLRVTIGADGATLTVEPGLAIDPTGRELCIDQRIAVAVPVGTPSPAAVAVQYVERPVDPLTTVAAQAMEPGRIEEGTRVVIAESTGDSLIIAQIICDGDAWKVDPSFAPARPR